MKFTGERMIPEFNEGQNIYLEHITRYIFASQFVKDKVVLDIACGSGYGVNLLSEAGAKRVIGVDISKEAVDYCKKTYRQKESRFIVGSVENIPLNNKSVDIVISFETIEHVDERAQKKFMAETKRVLKPNGIFIISTPNILIYPKGNPYHIKELSPNEFSEILKKDFSDVRMFYQDDVESSYVFSKKTFSKKNLQEEKRVGHWNMKGFNPEENLYLVAVCSNNSLDNIEYKEVNVGSNIKPWIIARQYEGRVKQKEKTIQQKDREINNLNQTIQQKDKEIINLNQTIQQKDQEIKFIKSSKFWKMRNEYVFIKNKLGKNNFLKKYGLLFRHTVKEFKNNGFMGVFRRAVFYFHNPDCDILKSEIEEWKRGSDKFSLKEIGDNEAPNKTKENLVSVIIPIYDRTLELKESIDSILNQTYQNFEIILVTDGSPRDTMDVVESYRKNPKIKIFHYYNNTGNAVRGRNKGIKESKGEFIAFQDSDDIAETDRLEKSLECIKKDNVDLVYGGWRVKLDGTRMDTNLKNGQEIISPDCDFKMLLKTCVPCQSTVMVRKKALIDVGGLKTSMKYREDHELWLRLAYFGYKFKAIPEVLTNLRIHKGNNELNFKKEDKKWYSLMLKKYKSKSNLPLKIVYIIPGTGISGGIAVILQHVNRLLIKGYDVSLLSQDMKNKISWFPNNKVPIIPLCESNKYLTKNIDILVATGWTTVPTMDLMYAKRKIYFVQSDERRFFNDKDTKEIIHKTYEIKCDYMTEALWIQRWLKKEFGHDAFYVPNGLDKKIIHRTEPIVKKGERPRVLIEGPISIPFKGMEDAYNAVKDLNCELWIISSNGKPKKGWRYDRFFESVPMEDMKKIYSSCDVFLKMSRIEGFFGPPMEAMACHCAVVVGKCTGYDEYVKDGYNALVVEMGDVEGAKKAIQKLIVNKNLRRKLIKNGEKTANNWSWKRSINFLEKVIAEK